MLYCIAVSGVVLTNAVNAKSMKADSIIAVSSNNDAVKKQESKFIIDSTLKSYHDMKKVQEVIEFKFKVPDFLPEGYTPTDGFEVIKASDKDNVFKTFFDFRKGGKVSSSFEFYVSKVNIEEFLKQDAENRNKQIQDPENPNGSKDDKSGKVATSIKYTEALKNVNYSVEREVSTELATLVIYDKEDLNKAKELLGFDPKLPLTINNDIKINDSAVGISGDSDIENKKINYELNTFYSLKGVHLTFTQGKSLPDYESIKKNGYIEIDQKEIKVQNLKIGDKEVFKYEDSFESEPNKQSKDEHYIWKEDGFYCRVSIFGQVTNPDEIIKGFVDSKPID
ncbi:hypothetical protein [Clostridium thailandense]|uniref:hypothetical protein n=1 Tax=Clostridium thailandense TaxID=2794346 RepID=UPI001FE71795|nr:hypothetical protein [Clostridium thailandense]